MTKMVNVQEPGDVVFVVAKHAVAKTIKKFQEVNGLPNPRITHVAICSDNTVVFEAQKPGKNTHYIDLNSWKRSRGKGEEYLVLRHPSMSYEQKLLPVTNSVLYWEREKYALRDAVRNRPSAPGWSTCSFVAAKVLADAGLAQLSEELSDRHIYPGQLYAILVEQGFQQLEWDSYHSVTPLSEIERFTDRTKDLYALRNTVRSIYSALSVWPKEKFEFDAKIEASDPFEYFLGCRQSTGLSGLDHLNSMVNLAISVRARLDFETQDGAFNWEEQGDFDEFCAREEKLFFSIAKTAHLTLDLAKSGFNKILEKLTKGEGFYVMKEVVDMGQEERVRSALVQCLNDYSSALLWFACLTGVEPERFDVQANGFRLSEVNMDYGLQHSSDTVRGSALKKKLDEVIFQAFLCKKSIIEFRKFLGQIMNDAENKFDDEYLIRLREDGILP